MFRTASVVLGALGFWLALLPTSGQAQSSDPMSSSFLQGACSPSGSEEFCSSSFVAAYQYLMFGCAQAQQFGHRADLIEADLSSISAWDLQDEFMFRMSDPVFFAEWGQREAALTIGKVARDRWPC